jgi:hypothetical protein
VAEKKIHGLPAFLTHRIVSGEGRVETVASMVFSIAAPIVV